MTLVTTRRVAARVPPGASPAAAAEARRVAADEDYHEARRDGGVGTHAAMRALGRCGGAHGRAATRGGSWLAFLGVMRDALEDLGSAHAPHLASSRALHLAHDPAVVVHPLARDAGARRAVLVGINYAAIGGSARLKRREGDVRWAHDTLSERGFDDPDGTRVLVDDGHDTGQPTRKNLMRAIAWLVKGAAPGDSLLFHFSGRASLPGVGPERSSKSSRTPRDPDAVSFSSLEGDSAEFDLDAESSRPALAAMDSDKNGCVTRGELHAALVRPLPRGVRLTVIIDVPDEGGAGCLQLPYAYDVVGDGEEEDPSRFPGGGEGEGREGRGGGSEESAGATKPVIVRATRRPPIRAETRAAMRLADALSADAMGEGGGEGAWERRAGAEDEGPRKNGGGCCVVS